MRVIDGMPNLRLLGMGLAAWPAYPLSLPCLEVLKADMFSEWVSSVLESSRMTLKKVMVDEIPEIVAEHFLSNCENLDECIITFSALQHLNNMERLQNLTLQIPESVEEDLFDICSPILSRVTYLQAEGKGGEKDHELLMLLGDHCTALKRLTLRGWGREAGKGSWMRSFRNVEWLTLDFTFQFRRSLVLRLVMGHMPKLRVLCFEDQEVKLLKKKCVLIFDLFLSQLLLQLYHLFSRVNMEQFQIWKNFKKCDQNFGLRGAGKKVCH